MTSLKKRGFMNDKHFTESDKEKVIAFLNSVAKNAKFNLSTQEIIEYYGLLSHMQKVILPKIHTHILEIKEVVEAQEEAKEE